eukprot:scaffold17689_cov87-Cylindrotheca_fusiformis.AAC.1
MVYDGTKSGLNNAIWVPRFSLPTVNSMLRAVDSKTFMADFDIGECFLNFVLHESMQALCGIDLSHFFGANSGGRKILWERWARAAMGLKSSPYQAVQAVLVAKETVLGDRTDSDNAYCWDVVRLNLPGSKEYDPTLPWVSKIRIDDGEIGCVRSFYLCGRWESDWAYGRRMLESHPTGGERSERAGYSGGSTKTQVGL